MRWGRPAVNCAAAALVAALVCPGAARPADLHGSVTFAPAVAAATVKAPETASPSGVGGLRLGSSLAALSRLVGPGRPGCELASPRPLVARLRPPLRGFATFDGKAPHRLVALSITAGARTARGIAVGASSGEVARAYPSARGRYARPSDPLQIFALVTPHGLWFELDRRGGHVTSIEIPAIQACE